VSSASRRNAVDAVRREFGEAVEGYELTAARDRRNPDLWHIGPTIGGLSSVGGTVYIVHAPTGRVFEVPGSRPPDENAAHVLGQLGKD
jgi:hypothetical protein